MPECQFPVFCCFWFQKILHRKYHQNRGKSFPPNIKDREASGSPKTTWEGAPRGPHAMGARPGVGSRPAMGRGPHQAPGAHLLPISTPRRVNPNTKKRIPRKVPSRPSSSISDRGSSDVLPEPCRRGKSSPEASTSSCLPPK